MAINAIRSGLADGGAATSGNSAAAFNYAYTQNKMQTTSMWAGMALQAREFLPMMQSILFLLFGCVSFLVVALAMLPGLTKLVLTNYAKGFVYLGTWPVVFAFINFIMTTRLSLNTAAVADIYSGITLSNVDAMAEMHSRYAAMTGFLMMSVPMIVGFIVKGGASVMGSMSHQFAGMMNSVNSRTSASAASGDINLGNGQVDNFSFNNMNGNKTDTSALQRTHGVTTQDANGGMTTDYGNGNKKFDGSGMISSGLGFDLNSREAVSHSLRSSARETQSQAEAHRSQYNQSTDKTFDQVAQFGQNTNKALSYADVTSNKESASAARAVSTMNSTVDEYAKHHGISREQSKSELTSKWLGGSASAGLKTPDGLLFGFNAGGQLEGGKKTNWDDRTSDTTTDSESDRQSRALQKQFNESANVVKNYDLTDTNSETRTKTDTALAHIGGQSAGHRVAGHHCLVGIPARPRTRPPGRSVEDMTDSVSFNLMPDFQAYVKEHNPDHYEGIMFGSTEEMREQRAGYISQFMSEQETQDKIARYTDDSLPQSGEDLRQANEQKTGELALTPAQLAAQQETHKGFQQRHDDGVEGLVNGTGARDYFDERAFNRIELETQEAVAGTREEVANKEEQHQTPLPDTKPQPEAEPKSDVEPHSEPITHPAMGRGTR